MGQLWVPEFSTVGERAPHHLVCALSGKPLPLSILPRSARPRGQSSRRTENRRRSRGHHTPGRIPALARAWGWSRTVAPSTPCGREAGGSLRLAGGPSTPHCEFMPVSCVYREDHSATSDHAPRSPPRREDKQLPPALRCGGSDGMRGKVLKECCGD